MPDHIVSLTLFDLLDEYGEDLNEGTAIRARAVPRTAPVLIFTENAFAQFFENELGREIRGFDATAKRKAADVRRRRKTTKDGRPLSNQARLLISLFERFCDMHEDVIGAGYGGGSAVLEEFHETFMVRLLERLRAFAGAKKDRALRSRADDALSSWESAIEEIDWDAVSR
jgi:hypothetical protein